MSIWKQLFTAIKGGATEAAEALVDSQAMRILDQEIRDAKEELRRSDTALVGIIAKRKLSGQKVAGYETGIAEYEQHARAAAEKGQQDLALECATRVATLRSEQNAENAYLQQFTQSEKSLKTNIAQAKDKLRQLEQQVDVVKANDSVQKAQAAVSTTNLGASAKMHTAVESLERIKTRQQERQAQFEAASELDQEQSGSSLDKKLADAGITGTQSASAQDELARILGKK